MGETTGEEFEWAVKNGDLEQVKTFMLESKNKNKVNEALGNGRQALLVAADYGQKEVLEYLIANGANVNVKDKYGITPLLAAVFEGHTECVKLLLAKGADKSGVSPDGRSYVECAESQQIKDLLK